MDVEKCFDVAESSLSLIRRKIRSCFIGGRVALFDLRTTATIIKNLDPKDFECTPENLEELLLLVDDSEEALSECQDQVSLLNEQLKIVKETNSVLVDSMNALKKEGVTA